MRVSFMEVGGHVRVPAIFISCDAVWVRAWASVPSRFSQPSVWTLR